MTLNPGNERGPMEIATLPSRADSFLTIFTKPLRMM